MCLKRKHIKKIKCVLFFGPGPMLGKAGKIGP